MVFDFDRPTLYRPSLGAHTYIKDSGAKPTGRTARIVLRQELEVVRDAYRHSFSLLLSLSTRLYAAAA